MSWPQWSATTQPPVPSVLNPAAPVINSAPAVVPPGLQYTPEQWAQLQQQNWNQWAQWQQQYQQWHQQYGAEYQKSMNALAQAAQVQQPVTGLPNVAVPPPLPVETKPPLPTEDPPPGPPSYTTAPPPPQPGYNTTPVAKASEQRPPVHYSRNPPPNQNQNQNWQNQGQNYRFDQTKRPYEQPPEPEPKRPALGKPGWQNQPPPQIRPRENVEELSEAEKKFDKQFAEWEGQFQKWKEQNAEHPDKEQYREYEKKWESWRAQLLERREQMKRKRLGLPIDPPNRNRPAGQSYNSPQQNFTQAPPTRPNFAQAPPPQPGFSQPPPKPNVPLKEGGLLPTPPSFNKPPPTLNDEPLKFKEAKATLESEDVGDFIKPNVGGGIPGLDLVKDEAKPPQKEGEEVVDLDPEEKQKEKKGPDFDAISKGINSILGDQKLLNMLSMVSQTPVSKQSDKLTNTVSRIKDSFDSNSQLPHSYPEQSNLSYEDHSNHSASYNQREFVNNFDDQTRSSFTMAHNEQETRFDGPGNFNRGPNQFPDRFGNDSNRGDRFPPVPNQERFPSGPNQDRFGGKDERFGFNQDRFASDQDRFGPNQERFGPNENRFGGNQDRFGSRFGPGQDRFGPNQEKFGPNQDKFGPNQDKFGGPHQDKFSPNQNKFGPNHDKFGPNQDKFVPNQDKFGPNQDKFSPNPDKFNQNRFGPGSDNRFGQDRFAPNKERFGANQDRFGPNQDRFGPNQERFGPNQERFGPNQERFGPNQERFGPNQDRFGPNQDKIGPNQDKFGQNKDRFGPNQERFGPNQNRAGPSQDRFGPNKDKFGPNQDRYRPNPERSPNQDRFVPNQERFGPGQTKFGPNRDRFGPNQDKFEANEDRFGPNQDRFVSQRGDFRMEGRFPPNNLGPKGGSNFNQGNFDESDPNSKYEENFEEYDYDSVAASFDNDDHAPAKEEPWEQEPNYQQPPPPETESIVPAPPPPKEEIFQATTVIDYDHKSTKLVEPEVLIEPIYMFDYRHKPLSRLPLSQRPKWLSETVRNIREFDPPVVRPYEPRRYPPPQDNWRNDRYQDNWQPHNRRGYEERPPYEERRSRNYDESRGSKNDWNAPKWEEKRPYNEEKSFYSEDRKRMDLEEEKISDTEWPEDEEEEETQKVNTCDFPRFQKQEDNSVSVNKNVVLIEDLINPPGRYKRPPRIVIILRGPPGSGKTFLAKLIKDKEVEGGGSAPRILSLDDYFMVEQEKEVTEEGKKVKVKEMIYEYEAEMEESYRTSLIKSFKKTITDGYFSFIIVDNVNDKVKYFGEMWSFAKQNGFQVYICQLDLDVQSCSKRNIHGRSEADIEACVSNWEPTPAHHPVLDATSLLQSASIPEVEMEEVNSPESDLPDQEGSEDQVARSKWDNFDCSVDNLAKLDGVNKPLRQRTMEEYLQLDTQWTPAKPTRPGQKRVRWADLEEQKQQEKMRAIGFVVGHTNWDRMMDPTGGSSALTQTKYIERTGRYKVDQK